MSFFLNILFSKIIKYCYLIDFGLVKKKPLFINKNVEYNFEKSDYGENFSIRRKNECNYLFDIKFFIDNLIEEYIAYKNLNNPDIIEYIQKLKDRIDTYKFSYFNKNIDNIYIDLLEIEKVKKKSSFSPRRKRSISKNIT